MIVTVKVLNRPRIEVPDLSVGQMFEIGKAAEEKIEARVHSGIPKDINGRAAPPLSPRWKAIKERRGRRGVRDLVYTGALQADMSVYRAKKGYVYVGFKSSKEYMKGFRQQKKFEWFGLSAEATSEVVERAEQLYAERAQASSAGRYGIL